MVPDNQNARIILVDVFRIGPVVHPMVEWRVEEPFEDRPHSVDGLRVDPDLVQEVESEGRHKDLQGHPQYCKWEVNHPGVHPAEPGLSQGDTEIVFLALMMDRVSCPEQIHPVADAVIPIVGKVDDERTDGPGPPRRGRHVDDEGFVEEGVRHQSEGLQEDRKRLVSQTTAHVRDGIIDAYTAFLTTEYEVLDSDQKQEEWDSNADRVQTHTGSVTYSGRRFQ